jgi:hypothetical protein
MRWNMLKCIFAFIKPLKRFLVVLGLHQWKVFFAIFPNLAGRIFFVYDAQGKFDGLGAQIQRIIGIAGLARYFGLRLKASKIEEVAIHPLDGISYERDYRNYLKQINEIFRIGDDIVVTSPLVINVINLRFSTLSLALLSLLKSRNVEVRVTHPYPLLDACPKIYKLGITESMFEKLEKVSNGPAKDLVLHHRQTAGNQVIQPGQNISREIPLKRYLKVLGQIEQLSKQTSQSFSVLTDAPNHDCIFTPPKEQSKLWDFVAGFDGTHVHMRGHSLGSFFAANELNPAIISGGNPLEALSIMVKAKTLILSRSSFGYVAAILSKSSNIFIPQDFWHPPLPKWRTF